MKVTPDPHCQPLNRSMDIGLTRVCMLVIDPFTVLAMDDVQLSQPDVVRFSRGGLMIVPAAVGCKRLLDRVATPSGTTSVLRDEYLGGRGSA